LSFGGGGSGALPITNHVHDNNAGEGGSLSDSLTLIANENLSNRIKMDAIVYG
jgi:hypothetical protein|tara:strand:+ start:213 stop:371 length:159 start_codon:yes stop_codon:yes gene_type:complete